MADTLYFSRDTKVYLAQGSNVWEIPVLDGFSFSQATNASEITLNEMADCSTGKSRRSRQMFTDSYAPAEWSFSTYVRPFVAATSGAGAWGATANHHCVEEALWANFVASNAWTTSWSGGIALSTSNLVIDFTDSETTTLGTFDIYFVLGGASSGTKTVYKIEGAVVNEAAITFDVDGIATINWSGFGKIITKEASTPTATIYEAISATSNFIRNRLTCLEITASDTSTFPGESSNGVYNAVLTGGDITFTNNITFLTPETLGVVNQPLGHVTGTRAVSGNFTCYLNAATGSSGDLFEDLIEATSVITNSFALTFSVGGTSAPKMVISVPNCHLEVPTHDVADIISLSTAFHALPSSIDPTAAGSDADDMEAKIIYTGTAY